MAHQLSYKLRKGRQEGVKGHGLAGHLQQEGKMLGFGLYMR